MSQNLMTALSLASSGLYVFPCAGTDGDDGKRPLVAWRGDSTTDPDKIGRWFTVQFPGATVGVDLARSGLWVLDIDTAKPPGHEKHVPGQINGADWFEPLVLEHGHDSFPFVYSRTPSSGVHYIFRQPADGAPVRNARGGLPKKKVVAVDARGQGGYIIAPGATMQDGRTYVLNGSLADVPEAPDWLLAIMRAEGADDDERPPAMLPVVSLPPSSDRVGAYSAAGFEAEINEVRTAPKGARNDTLNTCAFKVGTMVGAGWVSEADAYSALVSAVSGWSDQRKTIDTLKRGLREGMAHPRPGVPEGDYAPPDLTNIAPLLARLDSGELDARLVEQEDGTIIDGRTGEVVSSDGGEAPTRDAGRALQHLNLHDFPPGLVGKLARWIVDTSRRPQPVLALGAALTIVGTAAGQHFYGPTGAGTHLYVLGLAPTGSGKDRPLKACTDALCDAGLDQLVGPGEFISMPAVINSTVRRPVCLAAMDEFGAFLKRVNSKKASGFETSITKMLREFWSAGYGRTMTPEWASREREVIFAPCLSIFGVSTPDEFLESVSGADVKNGTLNRFLILPQASYVVDRNPVLINSRLPEGIVTGLRGLRGGDPTSPLVDVCAPATPDGAAPTRLVWGPGAEEYWQCEVSKPAETRVAGEDRCGNDDSPFFVRVAEMSVRIATVIALGRGSTAVSVEDVRWGGELAWYSANAFLKAYRSHVSASDHSERLGFVEAVIRRARTITRAKLTRAVARRMDARQLEGILGLLVEAERIAVDQVRDGARGRVGKAYSWLGAS